MTQAIQLLYASVKDRLPITFEQFADALKGWDLVELNHNNELVGVVMIRENELHVGYKSTPKASIRSHIKKTLAALLEKYGQAVTSVQKTNEKGLKFCQRLGFVVTGEQNGNIYMRCDRSNYVS